MEMHRKSILFTGIFSLIFGIAHAGPGDLDLTFNPLNGFVTYELPSEESYEHKDLDLQQDGKILVTGDSFDHIFIMRFNRDGSLDETFGTDGMVTYETIGFTAQVEIQSDGKIVFAGGNNGVALVLRYKDDGTLDSTFGTGGVVTSDPGLAENAEARAVFIQPDGKIIIACRAYDMDGPWMVFKALLLRYNSDGTIDGTFGTGGVVTYGGKGNTFITDIGALQRDGKILLGSQSVKDRIALLRFNNDGSLDDDFGTGGIARRKYENGFIREMAFQPNGKIVVLFLGSKLARFKKDGSLDKNFGRRGYLTYSRKKFDDGVSALAIQQDGKIMLAGYTRHNSEYRKSDLLVLRYKSNGILDDSFGVRGMATIDIDYEDHALNLDIQPDGKIVVSGYAESDGLLIRLQPSVTLFTPIGGEVIPSGSDHEIKWCSPNAGESFNLKYSVNNGRKWRKIVNGVFGTTYTWTVPVPRGNENKCLVKIIGFDDTGAKIGTDRSDKVFAIEVVKVTYPDGGETFTPLDTETITWNTNATRKPVAEAKLYYTKNGGKTWTLIGVDTGNSGSFEWTVPDFSNPKYKCRIKILLKGESGETVGKDASDGFFSIVPF
jgi:uncharacterized delta-60 repeat protein